MTYLMFHMHYLATALMKMLLFLPCLLFFQGRTSMRLMAGLIVITLGYMAELAAAAPVKLINLFIPDINLMPLVLLSQKQYLLYLILSGTDLIVNYICFRALGNVLKDHYRFDIRYYRIIGSAFFMLSSIRRCYINLGILYSFFFRILGRLTFLLDRMHYLLLLHFNWHESLKKAGI